MRDTCITWNATILVVVSVIYAKGGSRVGQK